MESVDITGSSHSSAPTPSLPHNLPTAENTENTYIRFLASKVEVGSIFGRRGSTINQFQSLSGARIQLSCNEESFPGTSESVVKVSGTINDILQAVEFILAKLLDEFYVEDGADINRSKLRLVIPSCSCSGIIGKDGFTIKAFIENSKAGIQILPQDNNYLELDDRLVTLTGTLEAKMQAISLILSQLAKDPQYKQSFIIPVAYAGLSNEEIENQLSHYQSLHKAATEGDWSSTSRFIKQEPDAVKAGITKFGETALITATKLVRKIHFVESLVDNMSLEDLAITNSLGRTALHEAVYAGNIAAARLLVEKNPNLPYVRDRNGKIPLSYSVEVGRREMVLFLLGYREIVEEECTEILENMIYGGFFDAALILVQEKPKLVSMVPSPLMGMAHQRSAFRSGASLNFWENLIYLCVPLELGNNAGRHIRGDIENPTDSSISGLAFVKKRLCTIFWEVTKIFVPKIKHIQEKKLKNHQALALVRFLCMEICNSSFSKADIIFEPPFFQAAFVGIHEIVEEIIESYDLAFYFRNSMKQNIFQYGILQRREIVFNLLNRFEHIDASQFLSEVDTSKNNALHLAGYLGPQQELRLKVSKAGAALQMQHELQWFKEVEKFVRPVDRDALNAEGKTPREVFTQTHKELVKEGEKLMKETATACTVVAVLVATVAFAVAITMPGGNNGNTGLLILTNETAFIIFFVANALAFFSAVSSVTTFLSILTSRYAENEFLFALPKRSIIGLVTLFLSFTFTMVAIGAAIYLVFGHKEAWILIPLLASASLPIILFAALQFPLLVDMIKSTYGPSIVRKRNRMLR